MRRVVVVSILLALVALGAITPAGAGPRDRPFQGSLAGVVTFGLDSDCPNFGGLRTDSVGTGNVSHLGRTVATFRHCTPAGDEVTGGTATMVAANGDELFIEYEGTAPFSEPTIVADIEFVIVGGTGRFEGATGDGQMTGYIEFAGYEAPEWPSRWVWTGTIGY